MIYKLTIQGQFPNLNDYLKAERMTMRAGGKFTTKGNELKKNNQNIIIAEIRRQLRGIHINKPVRLKYHFYEPNMKRDLDNISAFFHKVAQDAMVLAGTLENDGWKNIVGYTDDFSVDKANPRVEIEILEVD